MIPPTESENQQNLLSYLQSKYELNGNSIVVLLDADRTLYETDTSRILNDKANIDLGEIKRIFEKLGYVYDGFYQMNQIYSRIDLNLYLKYSEEIAKNIEFYPGVENFIKELKDIANVFVISSGIKAIVDALFIKKGLSSIPRIAGTHFQIDNFLIGRNEKGLICDYFKSLGKKIIAFGDSDVDCLMLQKADHAIIVVNHRNNQDLISKLCNHPSLSQISFKDFKHPSIPIISFENFIIKFRKFFN